MQKTNAALPRWVCILQLFYLPYNAEGGGWERGLQIIQYGTQRSRRKDSGGHRVGKGGRERKRTASEMSAVALATASG